VLTGVKKVAAWLGHADPAFTLRVYVDLLDEGLGGGLELNLTGPQA
jgi:integrase